MIGQISKSSRKTNIWFTPHFTYMANVIPKKWVEIIIYKHLGIYIYMNVCLKEYAFHKNMSSYFINREVLKLYLAVHKTELLRSECHIIC